MSEYKCSHGFDLMRSRLEDCKECFKAFNDFKIIYNSNAGEEGRKFFYKCLFGKNPKQEKKTMKKYRCKIDSPWGKKGEIINYSNMPFFDHKMPWPDLFEEIPDRWVPQYGETYWAVEIEDVVELKWTNDNCDNALLAANRVFRTKEKAEAVLKKILNLLEEEKEV